MELSSLLEQLNLSEKDGLYFYDDLSINATDFLSIRTKETLKYSLRPDAFFCINNEPLILFFDKPDDLTELQRQVWNFNQSPAIFINTTKGWIVKNGFNLLENKCELEEIASGNSIYDFEYFRIITGRTWEDYKVKFEQKNRVDFYLLSNIEAVRHNLIQAENLHSKIVNSLIGRVIFIRYLIDRNVELNVYGITQKEDFYNILDDRDKTYNFFQQVKDDFNGNLFPLNYQIDKNEVNEKDKVHPIHLLKIKELLQGGKIFSDGTYQPSLFDIYDFSIIPIEFVSNVYEKFIGKENQADTGAYYTPLFLVDYIQKETVSRYFKDNPNKYNCKVLDPACGSGVFLVETLRQIISKYLQIHPINPEDELAYNEYKDKLKTLLIDNIFGIDKDENAISVAVFSLYITLLDNLKPKSIVGFEFPLLENTNFFTADFFETKHAFNSNLSKQHFNFILGNPPWATKHPREKQPFEKYIENKNSSERCELEIENREIAEAFLVRVSDFNFDETVFIVVSKILYKLSRKKNKKGIFRKYFLQNFKLRQVFELSSVRHTVFGADKKKKSEDKGTAPATILFYSKSKKEEPKDNIIKHISLKPNIFFDTFKLLVIEKYDTKEIVQQYFIDEDWIWKVLVYGNVLDYYFIKRLKQNKSIFDYISDKKNFVFGKGISVGGGDKNPIIEHKKIKHSINSKMKGLMPYYINYTDNFLSTLDYVHRPRKINLYKNPVLLVGKGVSNKFKAKAALSLVDVIYTDAITGIKSLTADNDYLLYILESLFNSNLFSYFLVNTNSSIGIEREQSHDKDDKFSIPLILKSDSKICEYTNELKSLIYRSESNDFFDIEKQAILLQISNLQSQIENELLNIYNVSLQERSLIDYTNNVTIPLLKAKEKKKVLAPIKFKDNLLIDYAKVFINHFSRRFNYGEHYFEIEIIWSEYIILMKFKITASPSKEEEAIIWNKEGNKKLLKSIAALGFENLSNNLYLQKDIKGFEEDFFYIAKPNQYKSWHPALAYLDLNEFVEALHNIDKN